MSSNNTSRDPIERAGDTGCDSAWLFILKTALKTCPTPASLMDAIAPLAQLDEPDTTTPIVDTLEFVIGQARDWMQQVLEELDASNVVPTDHALAIHIYTLESPSVYSLINKEMHSSGRQSGLCVC
jgi:hypothetical protein